MLRWNWDDISYKLDITIEMGASNRNAVGVTAETKNNDKISKYLYFSTRAKKDKIKLSPIAAFINGRNSFPKAVLDPVFNM